LNQLVTTSDGSHTIYVPELDEHYHSIHGAVRECEFIFIKNGFDFCGADPLNIFEVGFGTGLNALLTAVRSKEGKREVFYTAVDNHPLDENITGLLNYPQFAGKDGKKLFELIHAVNWGEMHNICRNFNLRKIKGDITTYTAADSFNLIYFDAFGPDKQPGMWTREVFKMISEITVTNGIFVSYSVKGNVKRNLRVCGFKVTRLPGPPGKRQIIRAIKI
jgi:tRNA U34 5-methylaminomethyl-2-thiouridine-forming methyltransferase MnmC